MKKWDLDKSSNTFQIIKPTRSRVRILKSMLFLTILNAINISWIYEILMSSSQKKYHEHTCSWTSWDVWHFVTWIIFSYCFWHDCGMVCFCLSALQPQNGLSDIDVWRNCSCPAGELPGLAVRPGQLLTLFLPQGKRPGGASIHTIW